MKVVERRLWGAWTTYVGFLVLAVLFLLIAYVLTPGVDTLSRVACALSVGLAVGGITGLIHTWYLEREIRSASCNYEMERLGEHMHSVGVQDLTARRPLKEMRAAIETSKHSVRIVGSSLKGLVGMESPSLDQEAIMEALVNKVKRGVKLRLLLAHPLVAGYREKMEIREKGSIPTEIVENLARLVPRLKEAGQSPHAWAIRLYQCGPTVFCVEVDDRAIFLEPYPLGGTSMDNLCVKAEISSDTGNLLRLFMASHFDNAWERSPCEIKESAELRAIVTELKAQGCITDDQQTMLDRLLNATHAGGVVQQTAGGDSSARAEAVPGTPQQ